MGKSQLKAMKYNVSKANRLGNRKSNQDRMGVVETRHAILLVLADGLGGHAGGDLAAETVVSCAIRLFKSATQPISNPAAFINDIILRAQREVLNLATSSKPALAAKSTCVVCIVQNGFAHWGHLGDSRLYVVRNKAILTRTIDHSRVEELFKQGLISEKEKSTHPDKNLITRCIGSESQRPLPSISRAQPLQRGDVILLCSDGLWSPLSDREIIKGVHKKNFDDAIEDLASEAEETSYPHSDNISVVALRWLTDLTKKKVASKANKVMKETKRDIESVNKEMDDMIKKLKNIVNK